MCVTTKGKSKEEKQAANEEKEKKREKLQKKKALDERDFNVLSQLSKLNKAVVVVDEQGRESEKKDKELRRKNMELSRRRKKSTETKKDPIRRMAKIFLHAKEQKMMI